MDRINVMVINVPLECPELENLQSLQKGQQRVNNAVNCLGGDVINRILGYSLYLLGFPYDFISSKTSLSEAGLKTLVQQVNNNGIERFQDKRLKIQHIFCDDIEIKNEVAQIPSIKYSELDEYAEFEIKGDIKLKARKDDDLGKKVLTLFLTEAGIVTQNEAAQIIDCQRLAVSKNLMKFRSSGIAGLLDHRHGQAQNYKFNEKVLFEILLESISCIFDGRKPTKTNINEHLKEKFSQNFSERATALHLNKMGLTANKKELTAEIVRRTNESIDRLSYLEVDGQPIGAGFVQHIEILRTFKNSFLALLREKRDLNIFQIEEKIEALQAEMHVQILDSMLAAVKIEFNQCPRCQSINFINDQGDGNQKQKIPIKTSLGSNLLLETGWLSSRRCAICGYELDIGKDVLKLSVGNNYSPLAQKKICSANRAGSYENAVRNLSELTNIDLNRNQVRKISMHVGEIIKNEFDELYKDIQDQPLAIIRQRHPLMEELRINEKYLDPEQYLIVLAVDGGRMQMFDLIPPKKKMRWVETKIFRISVYDRKNLNEVVVDQAGAKEKKAYQPARIMPGLTTYGATNRNWEETGPLIVSHLYMRGMTADNVQVCISDGSNHITQKIFQPLFPDAVQILDYYHKSEALHRCLKINGAAEEFQKLNSMLWDGELIGIIEELKQIQKKVGEPDKMKKRNSDDSKVILDNLITHLDENRNKLQYPKFREFKYPIGSGSVESAVKLFGKRVKGTEKQWSEEGGEPILHLYAFLLSEDERWKKLWNVKNPWM